MKRLLPRSFLLASVCAVAALGLSCDSAIPTAPAGTILTISANPSQISLNGSSTITVVGRKPNGSPLNEGTEIFFSTDLGSVNPAVTAVDEDGVARTTLRGDGRVGTAAVEARVGTGSGGEGGSGIATVQVLVGRAAGAVSLQATPSSIPDDNEDHSVQLLAVVRDSNGQPLADAPVNFQTDLGSLASGGSFKTTNAAGEARDTVTVTALQLRDATVQTFDVKVQVSGPDGGVVEDSFSIGIDRPLVADFSFTGESGLTLSFFDRSSGNPTTWRWDFGDGTPPSTDRNPTHPYAEDGPYDVTLTVSNARGTDSETKRIQVGTGAA
jgi:hypothetical protein